MLLLSIFILIMAIALNYKHVLNSYLFIRIGFIIFALTGAISFNTLYLNNIGTGMGIYSGLFQITTLTQFFDLTAFYAYLDTLSLLELSAVFHILILILIVLLLSNIFSVLFGNEIINYFNLDTKYPKLNGYFKLRLKFQRYYLFVNILAIFIICLILISINLLVLI